MQRISLIYAQAAQLARPGITIPIDFKPCDHLRPSAVVALGGLIAHVERAGGQVFLKQDTLQPRVRETLRLNGFLSAIGLGRPPVLAGYNSVVYRHDKTPAAGLFASFLQEEWLSRASLPIGLKVRQEIIQAVVELHNNAFEHGGPSTGFFTCGQAFSSSEQIVVAFVDFGMSIPTAVRSLTKNANLSDHEALEWALKAGNSTKTKRAGRPGLVSRGLGFEVLQELVSGDGSHMEVYSGSATIRASGTNNAVRKQLDFSFPGTLVQITVSTRAVLRMLQNRPKPSIRF